jgi:hypothetical protein
MVLVASFALLIGGGLVVPQFVDARGTVYSAWDALYSSSASDDNIITATGKSCQLCHEASNGGDGWNGYGWEIKLEMDGGKSATDAILAIEGLNSDAGSDGSLNLAEINADTQPGWTSGSNTIYFKNDTTAPGSPPAGIGDLDPINIGAPEVGVLPAVYALAQSWPNPYRASTTIVFDLPRADRVLLRVFDIKGRLVKTLVNEGMRSGSYRIAWRGDTDDGRTAAPGIYFYRMETSRYRQTRKAIRL